MKLISVCFLKVCLKNSYQIGCVCIDWYNWQLDNKYSFIFIIQLIISSKNH